MPLHLLAEGDEAEFGPVVELAGQLGPFGRSEVEDASNGPMDVAAAHVTCIFRPQSGVRSAYKSSGFSERLIPQRSVKRCVVDLADEDRKIVGIVAAQGSHTDSEISQRQR